MRSLGDDLKERTKELESLEAKVSKTMKMFGHSERSYRKFVIILICDQFLGPTQPSIFL